MRALPLVCLLLSDVLIPHGSAVAQDTAPRRLTAADVRIGADLATVSGVRELPDGRLLVSDGVRANVVLIDPTAGTTRRLGEVGADSTQYAQPGGFYSGLGDTTLLLDRGQARFLVISPSGVILTSRSIKRRGVSESSSDDVDHQRLDSRGLAYFTELRRGAPAAVGDEVADSAQIIRLDAARQRIDTVAVLRGARSRVTQASTNMRVTQDQLGAPVDAWGIAPDGRIAVVRAAPYRVEWFSPAGSVVKGPIVSTAPIPYSKAERDSISSSKSRGTALVGMLGGSNSTSAPLTRWMADVKPPFERNAVSVAPDGRVWVARTVAHGVAATFYDVFDSRGSRVDRVSLGARSRVIGFGRNAVYAVERDAKGGVTLRKYKLS